MSNPLVTIIVSQRERYCFTRRSLESIFDRTGVPFDLIYVAGRSPSRVSQYLKAQSAQRSFRLVQCDNCLTPSEGRNLAMRHVSTKYALFIDNDVVVQSGWLDALVRCAEETDAWLVGPLYCEREPEATTIHMAGGNARIAELDGRRHFHEEHFYYNQPVAAVRHHLHRKPVEMLEFHCLMMQNEAYHRLGGFDEGYLSCREHIDLCLRVRNAGGSIYLEPDAIVTFLLGSPRTSEDLRYFWLRWSEAWNLASLDHFRRKWRLSDDDPSYAEQRAWADNQRRLCLEPLRTALRPFGRKNARRLEKYLLNPLELRLNRLRYPYPQAAIRAKADVAASAAAAPEFACAELSAAA